MRIIYLLPIFTVAAGLTLNERNELSRKFKYYFDSVRPTAPENFVSGVNGTYFNIAIEIHLIATNIKTRSLLVEAVVVFSWIDDRLLLRELFDRMELPTEFSPWLPRVRTSPAPHTVSILLSPSSGVISLYHRIKDAMPCSALAWKYPFETFNCELSIENTGEEVITLSIFRDFRPELHSATVGAKIAAFPSSSLKFSFSSEWHSSLLSIFIPSVLIVSLVFFAQWKRRKIQVLVSLTALVSILVMLTSFRPYASATLMDLWLSGTFVHTIFLLIVDLTLPARRVRYTLMVEIDQQRRAPVQVVTKTRTPSNRAVVAIEKLAEKAFGRYRVNTRPTSQLVTAYPGEVPIQQNIITTNLGARKRLALVTIAASYIMFIFIYLIIVISID